jgi:hypothetical protein
MNVVIHSGVILHGITLSDGATINNLQVEKLLEDPIETESSDNTQDIDNTDTQKN